MKKIIKQSSALFPLGLPQSKKLFKVQGTEYIGRQVMIIHSSGNTIQLIYADKPYTSWSTPVTIATDAADYPSDVIMDGDGNLYLTYTDTNNFLVFCKLTFLNGNWSIGNQVVIYNGQDSRFPTIEIEPAGKIWVGWAKIDAGVRFLCVKSSVDGGASWGTGPSDQGAVLSSGASSVYSKLVVGIDNIYAVWVDGSIEISMKYIPKSGGSWSSKHLVGSGMELDSSFDAAVSEDGMLGVVFDNNELKFREFDGANWGAVISIDNNEGILPQLIYLKNVPYVFYTTYVSSEEYQLKCVSRKSGTFDSPVILDEASKNFNDVILYENSSAQYANLTSAASNETTADIYHPSSNALIKNTKDTIYLGMNKKFRYIYINLFTAGVGGTVVYSYWDGSNWKSFTPSGENFNFDSSEKKLLLWDDYVSLPHDWQKSIINDTDNFWIKIEVSAGYSTPPVGSKLTALTDIHSFIIRR